MGRCAQPRTTGSGALADLTTVPPDLHKELPVDARLLSLLRAGDMLQSELAQQLGLTPRELESSLEALHSAGFEIEIHPLRGLNLRSSPDKLIGDDLLSRMQCRWLREITVFQSTTSTNDLAMQRGINGAEGPLAILAESQTAGRGRFGRKWMSAPGEGVWLSVLVRPEIPFLHWSRITSAAGLAVTLCLEKHLGLQPAVKWPNDVLLDGKKVCGVLVETAHVSGSPFAVLGIGINANQSCFPDELRDRATSLKIALNRNVDRPAFAAALLDELERSLSLVGDSFPQILRELEKRSCVINRRIDVHSLIGRVSGTVVGFDEEGHLQMLLDDGSLQMFSAGEVTLNGNTPSTAA